LGRIQNFKIRPIKEIPLFLFTFYFSKMPRYPKKAYTKKRPYTKANAYATKKDVTVMINKKHRIPNKYLTTSCDDTSIATAGAFFNLNIVPEGNGESERNSRKIHISRADVQARVYPIASATGCQLRMVLFMSKKGGGATPTVTSLFNKVVDPVNSFRQQDYAESFIILQDKVVSLNQATYDGTSVYGGGYRHVKLSHKFKYPMVVNFTDTAATGAVNTQSEGQLWFAVFSDPDGIGYMESEAQIAYYDD